MSIDILPALKDGACAVLSRSAKVEQESWDEWVKIQSKAQANGERDWSVFNG